MKKIIKYPLIGIGILVTLCIVIFTGVRIYWTLNSVDEAMPDDSDLIPILTAIPDEKNAYFDLIKAQDTFQISSDDEDKKIVEILSGNSWDENFVNTLLNKNKKSLDYFEKAAEFSQLRDVKLPIDPSQWNFNSVLSSFSNSRKIARLEMVKSMQLFRQGKEKEAFDLNLKTLKIGYLFQGSNDTLIGYLIGISVKNIGLDNFKKMSLQSKLPSDILSGYANQLSQLKSNEEGLKQVWKMEYTGLVNSKEELVDNLLRDGKKLGETEISSVLEDIGIIRNFNSDSPGSNFFYKPNQTKRLFADFYRGYVENSSKDCKDIKKAERRHSIDSKFSLFFTENAVGKIMSDVLLVSLSSVFDKKCQEDSNVIEAQVILAARAFENDNGKKPNNIQELIPKYLSRMPADPFTGKIVEYSSDKGVIISKERIDK